VLEAKMIEREDAFKSLPLIRFLAQKKNLIFSVMWQMLKCTQGNCILLAWPSSRAFPSSDITLQKKSLVSLKGDQNKNVQKEISFCSQGLHQFSPASASTLCKTLPFP
jgi:hypothetical protein